MILEALGTDFTDEEFEEFFGGVVATVDYQDFVKTAMYNADNDDCAVGSVCSIWYTNSGESQTCQTCFVENDNWDYEVDTDSYYYAALAVGQEIGGEPYNCYPRD